MAEPQPDNTGGCMLALYPPPRIAKALAVEEGLPPAEIHLTVAYAGKAADVEPSALKAVARKLARRDPITASISGHARFTGGETDVIVALADGPGLEDLRRDAMDLLAAQGVSVPREHGYCPHLTIRYADPGDPDPVGRLKSTPVKFAGISVVHGKQRTDYPFGGELATASREAYMAGWALSGGPMTEQVEDGCQAAIGLALESRDDPAVLEVSLHLGKLQGTWAEVYRRREELTAKLAKRLSRQWRGIVKGLDSLDLVRGYRRALLMREADGDGKPSAADTATAKSASLAWLQQVLSSPEYRDLAQEIADAIIASMAEGKTAALAVAADQAAALGFDWAKAYNAMYAGLAGLQNLPEMEAPWVQAIIQAAGADAGKLMATMAAAGASDEEIADALWGASADDAVMLAIDTAISGSMARGALDLYQSEGLALVDWMTAGDGRVCPVPCQDNEDNGPYDPAAFPEMPGHPRCRCAPAPAAPLRFSAFADFLVPAA